MPSVRSAALGALWRTDRFDLGDRKLIAEVFIDQVAPLGSEVFEIQLATATSTEVLAEMFAGAVVAIKRGNAAGYFEVAAVRDGGMTFEVSSSIDISDFTGRARVYEVDLRAADQIILECIAVLEDWTGQPWDRVETIRIHPAGAARSPHLILGTIPREIVSADCDLDNADSAGALRNGILTRTDGRFWPNRTLNFEVRVGYAPDEWPRDFTYGLMLLGAGRIIHRHATADDDGLSQWSMDRYSETLQEGGDLRTRLAP